MQPKNAIALTTQIVTDVEPEFSTLAKIHNAVNYKQEATHALTLLKNNNYLAMTASQNPDSLKNAILAVASIGLTLNPHVPLAYLVPRDGRVCLDISYRGYIALATANGALVNIAAELVHQGDHFVYNGAMKEPTHQFNPFEDRGPVIGAYCIAKTTSGEVFLQMMPLAEIHRIRDRSQSWRAYKKDPKKSSPWLTDEDEMIRKTVVRRAAKWWPKATNERLERAIEHDNTTDPTDLKDYEPPPPEIQKQYIDTINSHLKILNKTEDHLCGYLTRINRRPIKALTELTEKELKDATAMLALKLNQTTTKLPTPENTQPEKETEHPPQQDNAQQAEQVQQ